MNQKLKLIVNDSMKFFSAITFYCAILLLLLATLFSFCNKTNIDSVPVPDPVMASKDSVIIRDTTARTWLALGDSYTIGESVTVEERYPVQTAKLLREQGVNMKEVEIIARTGWTTSDLLSAIKDKKETASYDIVSILIGVNNQYRGGSIEVYRNEFTQLLTSCIQLAGGKTDRVVVISIPDYSVTPFASASDRDKIARAIDEFNVVNKQIADKYKVAYLEVTTDSRSALYDPSLIAGDGPHFSGKEYHVWAEKLAPKIKSVLH